MTLFRMSFQITNRCNLNCRHCLRDQERETITDLPLELFKKILRRAREAYGINYATLTGGEPLMYPELAQLFSFVTEEDFAIALVSNGYFIPKSMPLLKEPEVKKRLTAVAISVEGPDAEVHDSIRGPGSYKRALAAIVALKSAGIPVTVKYTIGRHNQGRLEEALLGFSHLNADRVEVAPMMPTPDNVAAGIMPTPEECREAESVVYRMIKELKTPITLTSGIYVPYSFFSCASLGMMDFYVDYRGRLSWCCMLPGLRGRNRGEPERDIIADLARVDLVAAHEKLLQAIGHFQRDRLKQIAQGGLHLSDHFQCIACARYFGKMDWLDALPDNPWSKPDANQGGSPCASDRSRK